jgi:tRNA (adenine22-N1)-methyltransferase
MTTSASTTISQQSAQLPALGPRLQGIFDVIALGSSQSPYDHLWDCCCDHGYLGFQLLASDIGGQVHFVDQLPHLISDIADRFSQDEALRQFSHDDYQLHAIDAGSVHFGSNLKHLAVFAGIGGELTIQMLMRLAAQHTQQPIDYVFCPSTTQFDLREYLHDSGFVLLQESLVTEKGRQYEIIWARSPVADTIGPRVSLTGDLWQADNPDHQRYLNKLITHYRNRLKRDPTGRAQYILRQYQACSATVP